MWNLKIITVWLLMVITFASCLRSIRVEYEILPSVQLKPNFRYGGRAYKETIEGLLAEVWSSGFLRNNEFVREEIINNNYGFFYKTTDYTYPEKGAAYYKREGESDKIMIHKKLFRHADQYFNGKVILKRMDKNIRSALVHELFHDFWHNLLDIRNRFLFSLEADLFYLELDMAKTSQDKVGFLLNIGVKEPSEEDFKAYEELGNNKENYPDQKFYGSELYARVAENAFSGKIVIPQQLRKFYYGIISESMLNKNAL